MSTLTIKKYKPYTSSIRHVCLVNRYFLSKNKPINLLINSITEQAGRNNSGHITLRHRGGGHKRKYRVISFNGGTHNDVPSIIKRLEYDPNRSGFIALVYTFNGMYSYILAPSNISIGDYVYSFVSIPEIITSGSSSMLKYIPAGSSIYNIEVFPHMGSKLCRAAGTSSILLKKENSKAYVKLPSGKVQCFSVYCSASIGIVSNRDNKFVNLGKAGRSRWLGIRPSVRGVAMNPVDHPHGGGEGRKSGKVCATSPWGKLTKGQKTSRSKKLVNE